MISETFSLNFELHSASNQCSQCHKWDVEDMHFLWCKTHAQVSVSQRHIPEKKINQTDMILQVSPKVDLGENCPMFNVYDVFPLIRITIKITNYIKN